jgi:hypothetical protein
MTTLAPTIARRLRRLLPAALIAATAVLGTTAFGDPGIAGAAPEFDVAAYDDCLTKADLLFLSGAIDTKAHDAMYRGCCIGSGGVVVRSVECASPPANAPGRTIPPGLPNITQTLEPTAPVPATTLPTFTLAPASLG